MFVALFIVVILLLSIFLLFSKALNKVIGFGFIYLIRRDTGSSDMPRITVGFMKELCHPWRRGKGVQIRIKTQIFQIGFCKKTKHNDEESGILDAMSGRFLPDTAKDIGSWK